VADFVCFFLRHLFSYVTTVAMSSKPFSL
jgi:hypothetical protein